MKDLFGLSSVFVGQLQKAAPVEKIAGVLVVVATIIGAPVSSRADFSELLQRVNLTAYSRPTLPPHFDGRTFDGRAVSLSSLQGKVVLLNFWATWCLECRPEMPAFERLHREFFTQGWP